MNKILVIGPLPPALGGIATIIRLLRDEFNGLPGVCFIDSSKCPSRFMRIFLDFPRLVSKIFFQSLLLRGGKVLIFASAYWSFWEKGIWILASRFAGARVVMVMVDGNFPEFYSTLSKAGKKLASFLISRVETLGVQSVSWEKYYREIFPIANIYKVIAGVDTDYFKSGAHEKSEDSPVTILYTGWLIEAKGIFALVEAASLLQQKGISFVLKLIGPTFGNEKIVNQRINELGLFNKVELMGRLSSTEDLRREYLDADIFVLPSHFEGFPNVLLEAMSSSLPCIGTNVGGIPDILDQGNCGLLVEKKSPQTLAEALRCLIEAPVLRRELGIRARERALQEYSLAKSLDSYRELLGLKGKI